MHAMHQHALIAILNYFTFWKIGGYNSYEFERSYSHVFVRSVYTPLTVIVWTLMFNFFSKDFMFPCNS